MDLVTGVAIRICACVEFNSFSSLGHKDTPIKKFFGILFSFQKKKKMFTRCDRVVNT